ncbi:hypothetical protein E5288_WYG003918 [Bos mutus]|uniref:Uncharacterized protein n=1 Tax=Bos mutus TaxID=72004 RepID=A0A6B0S648_9CETA|nr:hypothetical protein [Bos mutus]
MTEKPVMLQVLSAPGSQEGVWEGGKDATRELDDQPPGPCSPACPLGQLLSQKEFCPERQTVWFQRCTARLHPTPIVLESEPRIQVVLVTEREAVTVAVGAVATLKTKVPRDRGGHVQPTRPLWGPPAQAPDSKRLTRARSELRPHSEAENLLKLETENCYKAVVYQLGSAQTFSDL